jgi:hypothetical protein
LVKEQSVAEWDESKRACRPGGHAVPPYRSRFWNERTESSRIESRIRPHGVPDTFAVLHRLHIEIEGEVHARAA